MGIEPTLTSTDALPPKAGEQGGAADSAAAPVYAPQFRPMLLNAHQAKGKHESHLSRAGLNFNLSSFMSYYPLLRLTGYTFEAGYSPMNRFIQRTHWDAMKKIEEHNEEAMTLKEKLSRKIYGDYIPSTTLNPYERRGGPQGFESKEEIQSLFGGNRVAPKPEMKSVQQSPVDLGRAFEENSHHYKTRFNRVESVVFTGLAAMHSWEAAKQLKENFKLAVATEFGKDPKDITFSDLRRSNNPMVVSAVDRFCWQTPMRLGAGLAFLGSLWGGIIANSIVISTERTIFYRPIAYDMLSKAVNDVQINNLGTEAKGEVVDNLIRVLQAERFDHRQANIPREQIEGLRPVLDLVADDIISKRFGITGLMYVMGGGVLIPEDPQQSMRNYQHVRDVGVSGVMEEAKKIKTEHKVPSSKIWDAQLVSKNRGGEGGEHNIAESARREELLRERRAILARGPLHSMPGSSVDPDARYGSVQMY